MKKSTGIILLVVGLVVGFVLSNALSNKMVVKKEGPALTTQQKAAMDASIDAYFAKHPEAAGKTNVEQLKAEIKASAPKTAPSASGNLGAVANPGHWEYTMQGQFNCLTYLYSTNANSWILIHYSEGGCLSPTGMHWGPGEYQS